MKKSLTTYSGHSSNQTRLVYTTRSGRDKPHCAVFDGGEEKENAHGVREYNLACRFLDFDSQVFGKTPTDLAIVKCHGRKRISTLKAFPLQ